MKTAKTQKHCYYCYNNIANVDYKDISSLRRQISSYFKIAQRRRSGLCAKHQRKASRAVKQSREMGLLPYIPR